MSCARSGDGFDFVDIPQAVGYSQPVSGGQRGLTYRSSGVDIAGADKLVHRIAALAATTRTPEVLSGVGPFAAAVRVPSGYRNPVLLSSADGVGTKLNVAGLARRHDTVGIDLVAMNVNDLITAGARPLFFLDYLSVGSLGSVAAEDVISGIAAGCRTAGMSLVGGETAELPGFYKPGEYDLAGFCVGVAERRRIIDGSRIRPGDVIIGLPSSGLHSNGYSLARKALGVNTRRALARRPRELGRSLEEELLEPTTIYVRPVLAAVEKFDIVGMAHITGGGLSGNLPRVLPKGCAAEVQRGAMPEPPVFGLIREAGNVAEREMERTFNLGVGYTMIVRPKQADALRAFLRRRRVRAEIIGRVVEGRRGVRYRQAIGD